MTNHHTTPGLLYVRKERAKNDGSPSWIDVSVAYDSGLKRGGVCKWTATRTSKGRTSRMFYATTCGKTGAAFLNGSGWTYCPHCGGALSITDTSTPEPT